MKPFNKLLLATVILLCLSYKVWALQAPTLPYDLIVVGVDSDIDAQYGDQIIVMTTTEIETGFQFGLTNSISNNGFWETQDPEIEYINIKYIGVEVLPKGAALKIDINNSNVQIQENNKSITDAFEISYSPNYNGNFINSTAFYFSMYSGIMTGSGTKHFLLGTTLDVFAYGITEAKSKTIILPKSVDNKEVLLRPQIGSVAKIIDIQNCDLCDILLLILFSDSWLNLPNTYGLDLDLRTFDIRDCIKVDCPKGLVIDILNCVSLFVKESLCDTIVEYEWSKVINGQFFPLESGTSGPIPNLVIPSTGFYQLTIKCSNGCTDISNLIYTDCFEDDCDFDISITEENCIVSIDLSGCPDAQFQWSVKTEEGVFDIANSNSSSITATKSGSYFAKITGCPDCTQTPSPSIDIDCGESCDCNMNFYLDNCLIHLESSKCQEYEGIFEYYNEDANAWIYIPNPIFPYDPSEYGNVLFKYTLTSLDCENLSSTLNVMCLSECSQIELIPTFNEACNLEFNWNDCFEPQYDIYYASDCQNFNYGGAALVNSITLPNGSGSVEYLPLHNDGCYKLILSCEDNCSIYSDIIQLDSCCSSSLTIVESSLCTLSVSDIPCTGPFIYSLYNNGDLEISGSGTSIPLIPLTDDGNYQLIIECSGCFFFSNTIQIDCGIEECEANPLLGITECTLNANVLNCPNPQIQWQIFENGNWINIPGETSTSYNIIIDGTFQYILTGCFCVNEPLDSEDFTSNCFKDCFCDIQFDIDTTQCIINSIDVNCDLIISIEWYLEVSLDEWTLLPQFTDLNTINPDINGNYKKVIQTKNCGKQEGEIAINCVDECSNLTVSLIPDDCSIKVMWQGCFGGNTIEWQFTPSTGNPLDCGNYGSPDPAQYDIISENSSTITGSGSMEILPLEDGCYTFIISCNESCLDSVSTEFVTCCSENAEIIFDDSPIDVCDYCFVNECTDSLFNIYVLIDGQVVPLSIFDEFNFPYCDNGTGGGQGCDSTNCGDLATFDILVNDINNWFANYGYEGSAQQGSGPGVCKGQYSPLFIQQTNIEFKNAYLWEMLDWPATTSNGYQVIPFSKENCNILEGEPSLKVINACIGASYNWSTNETSQSIKYEQGQSYSVTITCLDGCTMVISYLENVGSLIGNTTNESDFHISQKHETTKPENPKSFKAYPNPTRDNFQIEYYSESNFINSLQIYSSKGQLVQETVLPSMEGNNSKTIDIQKLKDGLYILKLKTNKRTYQFQRIVIIR